jgi:hypothetical protein
VVEVVPEDDIISIYRFVRREAESYAILVSGFSVLGKGEVRGCCWRVERKTAVILIEIVSGT